MLQLWNIPARKTTPVTFPQKRCRDDIQMMRCRNHSRSINGTFQVTGNNSIQMPILPFFTHLGSLTETICSQFAMSLSLHDLVHIIHRLTMTH